MNKLTESFSGHCFDILCYRLCILSKFYPNFMEKEGFLFVGVYAIYILAHVNRKIKPKITFYRLVLSFI